MSSEGKELYTTVQIDHIVQKVNTEFHGEHNEAYGFRRKRSKIDDILDLDLLEEKAKGKIGKSKRCRNRKFNRYPRKFTFKEIEEERMTSRLVLDPPETKGYPALDVFLFISVMFLVISWTWISVSNYHVPDHHCTAESYVD